MNHSASAQRASHAMLLLLAAAGPCGAQTNLFSNAGPVTTVGLSTGATTFSGVVAPTGCVWSELQDDSIFSCNALAGVGGQSLGEAGAYRLADDFTVTGATGWRIEFASFYVYQPGGSESVSPFSNINVRVWRGRPGDSESTVVWGDTTTNRFVGSMPANIYRVYHSTMPPLPPTPDTSRRIWRVVATLGGLVLQPGVYWLDWQFGSVGGSGEVYNPTLIFAGERGRAGANARQLRPVDGGAWFDVIDDGKPSPVADVAQEFPFILEGSGVSCGADFDGDGYLSGADFDLFVQAFEAGAYTADFDRDGFITGADFDGFVTLFEAGC